MDELNKRNMTRRIGAHFSPIVAHARRLSHLNGVFSNCFQAMLHTYYASSDVSRTGVWCD
jgi:hypothetical protein